MSVQANPFKRTTIITMFAIGFVAFIALLYGLGMGDGQASSKNGRAHGASNSLVGYKALADILRQTGIKVQYSRTAAAFDNPGLLVLTPDPFASADDLADIMSDRAYIGPTMIILPKWNVMPASDPRLKKGWIQRLGTLDGDLGEAMLKEIVEVEIHAPEYVDDDNIADTPSNKRPVIQSAVGGPVKVPEAPVTISSVSIRAIVPAPNGDGALVAYRDDGGVYPQLGSQGESPNADARTVDTSLYPLVLVADADLLNNGGMADRQTARHALALMDSVSTGTNGMITFDLTFNGLGSSENLLTLSFRPPFLSATICLVIAALAAAWIAFNRFGAPLREQRSMNFGKTALVNNSAGFIHKMRREHLVTHPYGEIIRAEALHALGLSPDADQEDQNSKLDMLGEVDGYSFTALLNSLNGARNSHEIAQRAAALHHWKKELIG